jgi:protein-S-isoprenylcysteine O-methyltransferase Ste14
MTDLPSLGPRGEGWVLIQGILLVLVAAAGWSLGPDWFGPVRVIGVLVGIALIAGGTVLVGRGVADLGSAMTPLPCPREHAELVETGAYALVRHPVYGGLMLTAFGWAIAQASIVALLLAATLSAFFQLKSMREERWLEKRHPGYADYRNRTRRFVPWIG